MAEWHNRPLDLVEHSGLTALPENGSGDDHVTCAGRCAVPVVSRFVHRDVRVDIAEH
jgi:hypothetical protein